MKPERIGHWTKMRQSRVRFSDLESSVHAQSLEDSITNMCEFRFSVHTGIGTLRDNVYAFGRSHPGERYVREAAARVAYHEHL